jgi:hypothetical protein
MSTSTKFLPFVTLRRIAVLLFVTAFVYLAGYVHGSRSHCLYIAQYQAVDGATREPIDGHVTFSDREDIFPSPKALISLVVGNTCGVTFEGNSHQRALAWLGLRSSEPVSLPIYNADYVTGELPLEPLDGGFPTFFNSQIRVIAMDRKKQTQADQR